MDSPYFCRIFGLPEETCEKDVVELVSSITGKEPQVFLAIKEGVCQGWAWLLFGTREDVDDAIVMMEGVQYKGNTLHVVF